MSKRVILVNLRKYLELYDDGDDTPESFIIPVPNNSKLNGFYHKDKPDNLYIHSGSVEALLNYIINKEES